MELTRRHIFGVAALIVFSGLMLYGAFMLREYLGNRNTAQSEVIRTLSVPGLSLESGGSLDLGTLNGRVVVVVSWATWCPSCHQLLQDLDRAKERFGDKLEVVAVDRAEEPQVVRDYRKAFPLPGRITYVTDQDDAYFNTIEGRSMPELIIYDQEGGVVEHRIDVPSFDVLMTRLDGLID